jgi:hypothetical protein
MKVDIYFSNSGKMYVAQILVSLNIIKGLSDTVELSWEGKNFSHSLDYEGIPFKFHRCHKHGHMATDCHVPMKRRPTQGPIHGQRSTHYFCLGQCVLVPPPQTWALYQAWKEVNAKKYEGKRDYTVVSSKEECLRPTEVSSPTCFGSQLKKGVESHLGMPPLSPFSINFNFLESFSHSFLVLNNLKNRPSFLVALESLVPFFPSPPLSSIFFESTLASPDSLLPSQSQDSSLLSDKESFSYILRFQSIFSSHCPTPPLSSLGLNPSHITSKKGRGRKSFLSKAQSRAAIDVATGHQLSISGALRENIPPEGFT